MPNHVKNVLKFSKLSAKDKEFILEKFTEVSRLEDFFPLNRVFDFNKIIPQPKTEAECPDDCKVNKDSHIMEDAEKPWLDWYKWNCKYWGTKWGAYDGYVQVGKTTITFVFSTAWSAPFPIYKQLAKDYDFKFMVRFADEDIGSNCGIISYDPDRLPADRYSDLYEQEAVSNTEEFARRLWRNY